MDLRTPRVPEERVETMFGIALGFALDRRRDLVRRSILARLGLAAGDDPPWPLRGDTPVDRHLVILRNRRLQAFLTIAQTIAHRRTRPA
jgi:hypothetical protein